MGTKGNLWIKDPQDAAIHEKYNVQGRGYSMAVMSFHHKITSPTDLKTGKLIGNRTYTPIKIIKNNDQSAPFFNKVYCSGECLKEVKIAPNKKEKYIQYALSNKAAINDNGKGFFGSVLYIEEISFKQLSQPLHSLGINSKTLVKHPPGKEQLTRREKDCAQYLCLGMSAREIAMQLNLSKRTVESYLANMKDKLQVSSKSELIMTLLNGTH